MNVAEALDELRNNILRDASDIVSGASDQLWSDDTLVRYIDTAYTKFARRSLTLKDKTTAEVTQIVLQNGVTDYALHESILSVESGIFDTDAFNLRRGGNDAFNNILPTDTIFFDVNMAGTLSPGRPVAFSTDEANETLRVYPTPDATVDGKVIRLRVARLPLDTLSVDALDYEFEFPKEWHLGMLDYAAYLALRNRDVDAEAKDSADRRNASFEKLIEEAKQETRRKMFAPAQWLFGQNGFSWIR